MENIRVDNIKTNFVGCKFPRGTMVEFRPTEFSIPINAKEYVYEVPKGVGPLNVGDVVVTSCTNGFQVCVVTNINVLCEISDPSLVVGTVDYSNFKKYIEDRETIATLKYQLDKKKKELEGLLAYEILAEKDPEFKIILETYKSLGGSIK